MRGRALGSTGTVSMRIPAFSTWNATCALSPVRPPSRLASDDFQALPASASSYAVARTLRELRCQRQKCVRFHCRVVASSANSASSSARCCFFVVSWLSCSWYHAGAGLGEHGLGELANPPKARCPRLVQQRTQASGATGHSGCFGRSRSRGPLLQKSSLQK